jgi:hypothetical protein
MYRTSPSCTLLEQVTTMQVSASRSGVPYPSCQGLRRRNDRTARRTFFLALLACIRRPWPRFNGKDPIAKLWFMSKNGRVLHVMERFCAGPGDPSRSQSKWSIDVRRVNKAQRMDSGILVRYVTSVYMWRYRVSEEVVGKRRTVCDSGL